MILFQFNDLLLVCISQLMMGKYKVRARLSVEGMEVSLLCFYEQLSDLQLYKLYTIRSAIPQQETCCFTPCIYLSLCLSVTNCVQSCECNSLNSSRIFLKLCRCFYQGLKICMTFGCNPQINFVTFLAVWT